MPLGFKITDATNNLIVDEQGLVAVGSLLIEQETGASTQTLQVYPTWLYSNTFTIASACRILINIGIYVQGNASNNTEFFAAQIAGQTVVNAVQIYDRIVNAPIMVNHPGTSTGYLGGFRTVTVVCPAGSYSAGIEAWTGGGSPESVNIKCMKVLVIALGAS